MLPATRGSVRRSKEVRLTIGTNATRSRVMAALGGALALLAAFTAPALADAWGDFVAGLWPEAEAQGVSRATFDAAFRGLKPDYSLPDLIVAGRKRDDSAGQAEFTKSAIEYLNPKYLEPLSVQGRKFLKEHEKDILNIEKKTGVDRYIMVAIWGRETAYGTHKDSRDAIRVLATQAYTGRRKDEFRLEILAALKMLQAGVPRAKMKSSWAGAVGLTQFMPTEYFKHLEDGDGDGKVDIFDSVPDALASAARQLANKGWVRGLRWGYEVHMPEGGDCSLEGPPGERTIGEWQKLGFERTGTKPFTPRRGRHQRLSHDALRRLRPRLPGNPEFQGHSPLQHFRSLRPVRRRSRRPHRRCRRLPRAGGTGRAAAHGAGQGDPGAAAEARLPDGQDRRQDRLEHAPAGRHLPEVGRPQDRLLADGGDAVAPAFQRRARSPVAVINRR